MRVMRKDSDAHDLQAERVSITRPPQGGEEMKYPRCAAFDELAARKGCRSVIGKLSLSARRGSKNIRRINIPVSILLLAAVVVLVTVATIGWVWISIAGRGQLGWRGLPDHTGLPSPRHLT